MLQAGIPALGLLRIYRSPKPHSALRVVLCVVITALCKEENVSSGHTALPIAPGDL